MVKQRTELEGSRAPSQSVPVRTAGLCSSLVRNTGVVSGCHPSGHLPVVPLERRHMDLRLGGS